MAGSEGALGTSGFQDIATVTRALGAQLVGLTRDSPAARSELGGLFQMAGYRGSDSFKALSHWIDKGNHSMKDASGIINKATGAMSNMEQVASNLGDVMNSQVTSAIDAAALSATHFTTYTGNLTKALANNGTYGGHTAAYWAEKAGAAYSAAGTDAADATGKISGAMQRAAASVAGAAGRIKDALKEDEHEVHELQADIDALHGKTINVMTQFTSTGNQQTAPTSLGRYITGATGGYVQGPGTPTSDSVHARLSTGEFVMQASAVDHYGRGVMEALNARRYASGGAVGTASPVPATLTATMSGGSDSLTVHQNQHITLKLDNATVGAQQRREVLVYQRRNPANNLSLRTR